MQRSVGSVSGYRLAVRRAGATDGGEPLTEGDGNGDRTAG